MSGEKEMEKSKQVAPDRISESSTKRPEEDMREDGVPSESIPSESSARDTVSETYRTKPPLASVQGVYYPPRSFYDLYYPGYNCFAQSNNRCYFNSATGSYTGIQPNSALLCYLPGYGPHTPGFVGTGGRPAYTSSRYIQQPCSYQSGAFPFYTCGSTVAGSSADARLRPMRSAVGSSGSGKSDGLNHAKSNNNLPTKPSALPFNPRIPQPGSHFSTRNHSLPLNRLGPHFQSSGLRNPGVFTQYSPALNYHSHDRVWNNTYRYKSRESFGRSEKIGTELTRGPRTDHRNDTEVEQLEFTNKRDEHNLQKFQTEYDSAKFYVIKSYSEDDIHKCIKYDVWSSTTHGNKRLDAAFCEADTKTSETGIKCPVFLFFSVNGSGQFVGVAEMIGPVDFSKNMDFWQLDKWNGFFPVKWHIIKDVPNTQLLHITLENNESRPVTYSRDTQEISLEQGLEMLRIFKNHSGKKSVLDDFNFYENREKVLKEKKNKLRKPSQTNASESSDYQKYVKAGELKIGEKSV